MVARGFVEIYPPHGKYQLVVQEVEPRGAGAQALLLKQLKERLQRDGLLDPARKRQLPFLPRRVGVATSPTGAALRDFLRVLHGRYPTMPVLVAPCRVQGEGAAAHGGRGAARPLPGRVRRHRRHARWRLAGRSRRVQRRAAGARDRSLPGAGGERGRARGRRDGGRPGGGRARRHARRTRRQLVAPGQGGAAGAAGRAAGAPPSRRRRGAWPARRREVRALRGRALADPAHLLSQQRHRLDDLVHRAEAACAVDIRDAAGAAGRGTAAGLGRLEPRARVRALLRRAEDAARRLGRWQAVAFPRERLRLERLRAASSRPTWRSSSSGASRWCSPGGPAGDASAAGSGGPAAGRARAGVAGRAA